MKPGNEELNQSKGKEPTKVNKEAVTEELNESLSYEVVVTDKEGRVIAREAAPSRSYVEAWNKMINSMARQGSNTIKDTGGTNRSIGPRFSHLQANAGIGNVNFGIRVGRGSTPVDISDYALENPVAEGTGSGQLSHQEVQFTDPAVVGSTCSFKLWRVMFNYTGGTVSGIREIGCYVVMDSYFALAFRDVLGGSLNIPDGGAITVTYTIQVTA